ncbi:MAG: hypothetical protein RL217_1314 [Pseudomonadota bacterium]|jgi:transcriptional regulator with XRE-family HTH domain
MVYFMHSNGIRTSSPLALTEELGERLKQVRLNKNLTQQDIADHAGLSRRAVINAEKGKTTLEAFVTILMVLGLAEQLTLFLPPQPISPIQLAKLQGEKRQRASGRSQIMVKEEPPEW